MARLIFTLIESVSDSLFCVAVSKLFFFFLLIAQSRVPAFFLNQNIEDLHRTFKDVNLIQYMHSVQLWTNFIQLYRSYVDASPFERKPQFSGPKFTVKDFQ